MPVLPPHQPSRSTWSAARPGPSRSTSGGSAELEVEFAVMTGRLLLWERQQAALAAIGHRALVAGDLEEVLDVAVELAADTLDADLAEIREAGPAGLLLRAGFGWCEGRIGADLEVGDLYQAGYTFEHPDEVVVTELAMETRFAPTDLLIEHGVRSGVSIVLPDGRGGRYGVLAAHSRDHRDFDEDDTAFLAALADLLGDVICRYRATQALVAREAALAVLVERDRAVVWTTEPDGVARTTTSPAYEQLWGRPRAGLEARPADWLAAIAIDDVPHVLAALEALPEGAYDVTYHVHRPDGSSRLIHDRAALVLGDDGELTGIVGLAEDITDLVEGRSA
jgi:PAS domain-containing protein